MDEQELRRLQMKQRSLLPHLCDALIDSDVDVCNLAYLLPVCRSKQVEHIPGRRKADGVMSGRRRRRDKAGAKAKGRGSVSAAHDDSQKALQSLSLLTFCRFVSSCLYE